MEECIFVAFISGINKVMLKGTDAECSLSIPFCEWGKKSLNPDGEILNGGIGLIHNFLPCPPPYSNKASMSAGEKDCFLNFAWNWRGHEESLRNIRSALGMFRLLNPFLCDPPPPQSWATDKTCCSFPVKSSCLKSA